MQGRISHGHGGGPGVTVVVRSVVVNDGGGGHCDCDGGHRNCDVTDSDGAVTVAIRCQY